MIAWPLAARTQQIGLRCHQEPTTGFAADSLSAPSAVRLCCSCRYAAAPYEPTPVLATWACFTRLRTGNLADGVAGGAVLVRRSRSRSSREGKSWLANTS